MNGPPRSARWITLLLLLGVIVHAQQQPTFRSAVDVIAVDVQVIDRDGKPVTTLRPADFRVSIGGKTRAVTSATLIRFDPPNEGPGRLFIIAVDAASFTPQAWNRVKDSTRAFVDRLGGADRVGLYAYPAGPRIDPTTDHASIKHEIGAIAGQRQPVHSQFNLSTSEALDIVAEVTLMRSPAVRSALDALSAGTDTPSVRNVQTRECPSDVNCPARILMDATSVVNELEGQVLQSVSGLQALLRVTATYPGRKTIVLVSAGMAISDRPDGRPLLDTMARVLGVELARANAAVYTLHMDSSFLDTYSAEVHRIDAAGATEQRDRTMRDRWLEQFSTASGGRLLSVTTGQGESEFERVLRETSAYYLLGVTPAESDRDGRLRELQVKVSARGLTVRHREWVVVPGK